MEILVLFAMEKSMKKDKENIETEVEMTLLTFIFEKHRAQKLMARCGTKNLSVLGRVAFTILDQHIGALEDGYTPCYRDNETEEIHDMEIFGCIEMHNESYDEKKIKSHWFVKAINYTQKAFAIFGYICFLLIILLVILYIKNPAK